MIWKKSCAVLGVGVVLSLSGEGFAATTLRVDDSAPNGGNGSEWNGTSPNFAINNLQTAIGLASPGDTILIAQGTYKPGTDSDDTFTMKRIKMMGGYAGYDATNPDLRDPIKFETILSGEIGTSGASDNIYQVVVFNDSQMIATPGQTNETRLDGVTITGGYADDPFGAQVRGGGIYIDNGASPRIHRCKITNNYAVRGGAAVALARTQSHMNPSFAKLTCCVFENNSAHATVATQDVVLLNCGDGNYEIEDCITVSGGR